MGFTRIDLFISRKYLPFSLINLNIYSLSFLFLFSSNANSQSLTAEQIYKKVSDAVVVIHAYNDHNKLAMQGSGVVFNDKGYVVTNYHVLSGNKRIEILHGKDIIPFVDIIGIDVDKDILILKIEAQKFSTLKISDTRSLNIGQRIYAIGSPMGLENSISDGIISGLRSYEELKRNFIQITASISPGSSGGAVVNDRGELIGISSLTLKEGQNLNFAIPIEDVLKVEISSYSKNDAYKDFELFEKGNNASDQGNYLQAIKYYSIFIKKNPNNANTYYNRGIAEHKLKDYNSAIQDYNKAIELNPNDEDFYFNRGITKGELEDYQGSIQDNSKVIELNPDHAEAYYNRGLSKNKLQDHQGAIQDYNLTILHNPDYAKAYGNRGKAKDDLEDHRGAIQDYYKAIELNPNDAITYYNCGVANYELKNFLNAIQNYNNAIELNPNFLEAYYNRGLSKYKLEDYRGDIQDCNKAIELNPNFEEAYNNRGLAYCKLDDYRNAMKDFNKVILINPDFVDAYIGRGVAKYNLADKEGACLDWSKAGELGSADAYERIKEFCK